MPRQLAVRRLRLEQTKYKKGNRITIVGFFAIFTLPILVAWAAYFSGWFDGIDTTNKGEWVKPIISFSDSNPVYSDGASYVTKPGEKWKLIIPTKVSDCQNEETDLNCLLNLFLISQTHTSLGKNMERLEKVLFNGLNEYSDEQIKALQERFVDLKVVNSSKAVVRELPANYIYIADPLGNIMLRYSVVNNREEMGLKGKDILKDLKKLLKLSRLD
ncbi:MAG: hypothetical protein ACI9N9_000183 [Enterobacterales bacterium]